jgi:hypothetical protein
MAAMKLKEALQSLGYDLSLINQRDWGYLDKRFKQYREINSIPPAKQDSTGRVIYVGESDLDDLRVVADDFLGSPDYLNPLVLK